LWYTKDPFILPTSITKDLDSMYLWIGKLGGPYTNL
jgi:hypothetical protein